MAIVPDAPDDADIAIRRKYGHLPETKPRLKPGPRPHEGLDEADLSIIRALNADARKSYRDIARELGVALSTVSSRIKRLESERYIKGYAPILDAAKLGLDLVVVVGVKIGQGRLLDVQKKIARHPAVFGVYDTTGDWDSMVLARFRDREALNDFIKGLHGIRDVERTGTQLVLNTVKESPRLDV